MTLHAGQHVWFMRGRRLDKCGVVVTGELVRSSVEARVQLRVTPLRADQGKTLILVRLACIRHGEAMRCRQEMERCSREIATDEGALLGMRDWSQELKIVEGIS